MNCQRTLLYLLVLASTQLASIRNSHGQQNGKRDAPLNLSIDRFEYDGFRLSLRQAGLRAQVDFKALLSEPKENVIIVLGRTGLLKSLSNQLFDFYHAGGSLLLATDLSDDVVTKYFPIQLVGFDNSRSRFPAKYRYQHHADCPIVTNLEQNHQLFKDVKEVVANRPGYVMHKRRHSDGMDLAHLPPDLTGESRSLIYCMEARGRFMAIADHSFFVNEMLVHKDNAKFVLNCINWLNENGTRKNMILIRDDQVLPDYQLGKALSSLPLDEILQKAGKIPPIAPKLTDSSLRVVLNHFLTSLEDKDAFNASIANQPKGIKHRVVRRIAALAGVIAIASFFMRWLIRSQMFWWRPLHREDRNSKFQKLISGQTPNDRRQGIRLMTANYFSKHLPETVIDLKSLNQPIVETKLAFRKRIAVKRKIRRLWRIATGNLVPKSKRNSVKRLERQLASFQTLHDQGTLRLKWESH